MQIEFTAGEWEALDQAQRTERRVRHWRRYQAIRLLAHGEPADAVASAVGCRRRCASSPPRPIRRSATTLVTSATNARVSGRTWR